MLRRQERQGPGRQPQSRHGDDRRLHRHQRVQLPAVEGHHGPGGAVPGQPGPGLTRPHGGQFGRHVRPGGDDQRMGRHQECRRHPRAWAAIPPKIIPAVSSGSIEAKKTRGAKLVAVDPRFTRTAAVADFYSPIRAGTRHRLPARHHPLRDRRTKRYHEEYVKLFTNAPLPHQREVQVRRGPLLRLRRGRRQLRQDSLGLRGRPEDEAYARRPDAPEPALRLPAPEEARRPLHARDGRADLRHPEGHVPEGLPRSSPPRTTPSEAARSPTPSAGRSTRRRPDDPLARRCCSSCSATSDGRAAASTRFRGHSNIQGATDTAGTSSRSSPATSRRRRPSSRP